jgi:formylglycine-generating enzyme required for sulfatase activity
MEALRTEDPESYPITVMRDPAAQVDDLGPVFILINDEAVVGGEPDPTIRRAIAIAHDGEHPRLLVPIVAGGAPGLIESLDLGADRYRAIPHGGAGVDQVPFNGDWDLWVAAAFAEARLVIDRAVRGRQMAGLDLAAEAQKCRAAALAMDQAALSEAEALGEDALAAVRLAATSLNLALDGDPVPVLATPLRLIGQAIDIAGEYPAPATGAALNDAFVKVYRLERAGADAGRPRSKDSRAPTRFVKLEPPVGATDPANAENAIDQANLQAGLRRAAAAIETLAQGSAADAPWPSREVRAAARDLARAEALTALALSPRRELASPTTDLADVSHTTVAAARSRGFAEVTWIDVSELEATMVLRENAVRELVQAAARNGLSLATRTLIQQIALVVRLGLTSVRRLAARAFGRSQPPPLDRRNPGVIWRSRVPGVDPSGWPMMVTLPHGRFQMGSPRSEIGRSDYEQPRHRVAVHDTIAFGLGPVTFAMWDSAIAAGAELALGNDEGWGRGARPVINVSWEDAKSYIGWLNGRLSLYDLGTAFRLPTESEWEYACRAGTHTPFNFGPMISSKDANFDGGQGYGDAPPSGVSRGQTTPVGEFPCNDFDLYDMHGNVWEWCEDLWHDDYSGAPADGSAWLSGGYSRRVLRGGSWYNYPVYCRSAYRGRDLATNRSDFIGFRLARTLSHAPY